MAFKSVEEVDEKLNLMIKSVRDFPSLISYLQECENQRERWTILEHHIVNNLAEYGLIHSDWGLFSGDIGFLRDRFFYEMQKRTKIDFGFCEHFIPAYRERTKYFLSGSKEDPSKNWDRCNFGGDEEEAACNGTSRDCCVFLKRKR